MKVGICIPNYNMGKYLSFAIESALEQTYSNCTIYILDNNSQDDSWKIVNEYKNKYKNIKIFKNDYTISMEENWNKVLRLAKDEDFVNILSSDDKLKPMYVEKCLNIFEMYKDLGYVYSDRENIQENEVIKSENFYDNSGIINKNKEFIINIKGFHTAPCQLLIRNEALKKVGYLSTQFGIVSDMHLTLKLNANFDVGYLNEKLVYYSISSGMSTNFENIKLMAIQFHRLKKDILNNYLPLELKYNFESLCKSVDSFCAKFCISKLRHFIKSNLYEESKSIFLLSMFFDINYVNKKVYNYMLNNIKYDLEEFDKLYNRKNSMSGTPYPLPKNSIIFKG